MKMCPSPQVLHLAYIIHFSLLLPSLLTLLHSASVVPLSLCSVLTAFFQMVLTPSSGSFCLVRNTPGSLSPRQKTTLLPGAMHRGRHWSKKAVTKGDMKGDVAFLQCFFNSSHPWHTDRRFGVWRCHRCKWNMWWAKLKSSMKGRWLFQEVMDLS